ncbi:MAG: hypothetical protein WC007_11115 [Pelobacteraceae bacterium]
MKKEYDFSTAEQGSFYFKPENMKIPVYQGELLEMWKTQQFMQLPGLE